MSENRRESSVTLKVNDTVINILKEQADNAGRTLEDQIRHALWSWLERHDWCSDEDGAFESMPDEMLTVEIPAHLYRRVAALAEKHDRSVTTQIMRLLYETYDETLRIEGQVRGVRFENERLKNMLENETSASSTLKSRV